MTAPLRIALAGATGFIGEAVAEAAGSEVELFGIHLRVEGVWQPDLSMAEAVDLWLSTHRDQHKSLLEQLDAADVVVNAAGLARPGNGKRRELFDANAVLPAVLKTLAAEAGVRRFVHVSTAAVQGRRDPLDETGELAPITPYAESKAAGERSCIDASSAAPVEVVVYRPTSIMAPQRQLTMRLVRMAGRRFIPIAGDGDQPLPVCLLQNVAAGILLAATTDECLGTVLQPWEGISSRRFWELLAESPNFVSLPRASVKALVWGTFQVAGSVPSISAAGRRIELLMLGQRQEAQGLQSTGFVPPVGAEGYRRLAEMAAPE